MMNAFRLLGSYCHRPMAAAARTEGNYHLLNNPLLAFQRAATRNFASKKHKNLLKHAKGYRGRSKNCFAVAVRRVQKAWQYAYRDRRRKKREWRKFWIMRVQAGARQYGWRYSQFIPALKQADIRLNRKVLSELAANEPFAFKSVVDVLEHNKMQLNSR